MRQFVGAGGLATLLALVACSSNTPTTPTPVTPTTDTFSSTLSQTGSVTNQFVVNTNGQVTITLTSVTPLTTMSLGVGLMTSDGTNCLSTLSFNDDARANTVAALQGMAVKGQYCVRVYDSGNVPLSTTVAYTVTVEHP
jgi:hypothetical protein